MSYSLFAPEHKPKRGQLPGVLMPAAEKLEQKVDSQASYPPDDEVFLQNLSVELAARVRQRAARDHISYREACQRIAREDAEEDQRDRAAHR